MIQNQKLAKQVEQISEVNKRIQLFEELPKQVMQLKVCIDELYKENIVLKQQLQRDNQTGGHRATVKDDDISGNSSFNSEWVRQMDLGKSSDFGDAFNPVSPN